VKRAKNIRKIKRNMPSKESGGKCYWDIVLGAVDILGIR
jgi:hypothetical protein